MRGLLIFYPYFGLMQVMKAAIAGIILFFLILTLEFSCRAIAAEPVIPLPVPSPIQTNSGLGEQKKSVAISERGIEASSFSQPLVPVPPLMKPKETKKIILPHTDARIEQLIAYFAKAYGLPERLVRRVIFQESRGAASTRNGPYWGLMQISYPTAKSMGYQGPAEGLLDAETNLRYAVKYLAGAYMVAEGKERLAIAFYRRGFYYEAKRKSLLEATGLRSGPSSLKTVLTSPDIESEMVLELRKESLQ